MAVPFPGLVAYTRPVGATELKCELSWSASRAREFQRCRREYWYARYATWGWWKEGPEGEKRRLAILKNLTSLPAFTGDCVHRAIARWFELREAGSRLDAEALFLEARELFRRGWRESRGEYWRGRPSRTIHLEEHHYGPEPDADRTEKARLALETCTRNFLTMPELEPVRASEPGDWLAVEAMDSYLFLGAKVYAVPDFAARQGEEIHIWDWKTGRPREADSFQLHTYALYACERWAADPEAIVLHAVYLGAGQVHTMPVDIERLSTVQDRMSESVRAMLELHYDPDQDPVVEENWPTSGAPAACPRCRFREVCPAVTPPAPA